MKLYTPRRVKAPSNVAASERLFFYLLLLVILSALSTKVLREGCSGLEWPRRLLETRVEGICEGIWSVVLLRAWIATRHGGGSKEKEMKLEVAGRPRKASFCFNFGNEAVKNSSAVTNTGHNTHSLPIFYDTIQLMDCLNNFL